MRLDSFVLGLFLFVISSRHYLHPSVCLSVLTPLFSLFYMVQTISLSCVDMAVVDEADLVFSFGYEDDLRAVAAALPAGTQAMLMSATLTAVR